jgi:hypothetical protein
MLGHGLHPLKAQHRRSIKTLQPVHPEGRTPSGGTFPRRITLYRRELGEIEAQGAILVEDPFAGSGFADLRAPTVPGEEYDARGLESLPYDLGKYLERLGPDAAIKTFAEFAAATKAEDPFAPAGVLSYMPRLAAFNPSLADLTKQPDMSAFIAAQGTAPLYLQRGLRPPSVGCGDLPTNARAACGA